MEKNFDVGNEVYFQAYEDHEPVPCIIKNKGTLDELDKNWFNVIDDRIFYIAQSKLNNSVNYLTTAENLYSEKPWFFRCL